MKLSNTKILLILLFIQLSMVKSQTSEEFSGGESNPRFFPYPEWLFQGFPLNLSKVVTTELPTGLPTGLLTGQPTELSTGESSGLSTEESSRLPTGQPLAPIKSISANAQCSCKDTNELKGSLRHQQAVINNLLKKIEYIEANPLTQDIIKNFSKKIEYIEAYLETQERLIDDVNETVSEKNAIGTEEIRELINQEWRKRNHCPVGVTDGRILDSDITASTSYLNRPSTYGAHLGRLDNQPASGNIGAWRSVDVPVIRSITCTQGFYSSAGSTSFTSSLSRTDLTQMVRCPRNCASSGSYRYNSNHRIYGSGTYTDFSSICRAAIHNGKITDARGGIVTVHRVPRKQYSGITLNRISSSSYTAQTGSFTFRSNDLLPWIQVDFHIPTLITGVVTQGRPTSREEWIQTFKIQYGNNQTNLATMKNGIGIDIMFTGNNDRTSHKTNIFLNPIRARFVRIVAYSWQGGPALRFEFLSC